MSDSLNKGSSARKDIVMSPCISVCALDENDICIGCFRSAKEIGDWGRVDNDGKRNILKNVARRMSAS
ncbi:MAG: DUF1289 domain-containing protein [Ketobacteraceae bacterium]|nr:DUF1289 domain-containing protein [Ketobacteraceae bacterium]